jgi:cbb3-type cytochrome oxidase subunit 3
LALINDREHTEYMEMIILLGILLLAGVYSVLAPDNRDYDDRDRRGWWPGRSR